MSLNDICVEISRFRNTLYAEGKKRGAADAMAVVEQAQHVATDLLQHIDWLTNGLPAMLESGGLTDEEGLIGAAVDAANSARQALAQCTAFIEQAKQTPRGG